MDTFLKKEVHYFQKNCRFPIQNKAFQNLRSVQRKFTPIKQPHQKHNSNDPTKHHKHKFHHLRSLFRKRYRNISTSLNFHMCELATECVTRPLSPGCDFAPKTRVRDENLIYNPRKIIPGKRDTVSRGLELALIEFGEIARKPGRFNCRLANVRRFDYCCVAFRIEVDLFRGNDRLVIYRD